MVAEQHAHAEHTSHGGMGVWVNQLNMQPGQLQVQCVEYVPARIGDSCAYRWSHGVMVACYMMR